MKKLLSVCIFSMFFAIAALSSCAKHECVGEWKTIKTPTIISAGLQEYCCEECGKTTQQEIPALGIEKGKELLTGTWCNLDPKNITSNDFAIFIDVHEDFFNSFLYMFGTLYDNVTGGTYTFTDSTIVFKFPDGKIWGAYEYTIEEGQIKKLISIDEDDGSKGDVYLKYEIG